MTFSVAAPSADDIKKAPRAFGLYRQALAADGSVDAKKFTELARKYGDSSAAEALSGEVSFADAAKALTIPPSKLFDGVETEKDFEGTRAIGLAAMGKDGKIVPYAFTRRQPGATDVTIQIAYVGICHSDYHQVMNEWGNTKYPVVPGHEIVGVVTAVGAEVDDFKVGDLAGVGCMVESCRTCEQCKAGDEQYCSTGCTFTYNGVEPGTKDVTTKGGYSDHVIVNKDFVLHIPGNLPLDGTAPLLCAGITVYSPLKHYNLDKPGLKIGVVGLGGLGHMAVKIAKAMGADVTVISTSDKKREEALGHLGAQHFLISKDEAAMKEHASTLDGIIDTVSAKHPLPDYLNLLKLNGRLAIVGVPPEPLELPSGSLVFQRRLIGGSLIGGIRETQEMLDFCGKHNIVSDVEVINADYVNKAYERLPKNDVHYRFVIDVQGSMVQ